MHKAAVLILLLLIAPQAYAQSCPDFYRFVDFGKADQNGVLRRGGPILRAFDTQNTTLLKTEHSICLPISEVAKDGRGLDIPIVSTVRIDPELALLDLKELELNAEEDLTERADTNALNHQDRLTQDATTSLRGDSYLCAHQKDSQTISCQLVSPFGDNTALVIYCDRRMCEMPVLAWGETVRISARWDRQASGPEPTALEVSERVKQISDFVERQFSGKL